MNAAVPPPTSGATTVRKPNVFMFPGQGSQYYQMGRALYDGGGVFAATMDRLDRIVVELTGRPLVPTLYGSAKANTPFDNVLDTHPAIFMVEVALAEHLASLGVLPDMVLGTSLGAFAAAAVAGCIGQADALALVIHKAQCMASLCAPGGMLAVFGDVAATAMLAPMGDLTVAGRNFPGHFLVSGTESDLRAADVALRGQGITTHPLPVKFAFHSPLVDPAREAFLRKSRDVVFKPARLPFVCCAGPRIVMNLPPDYLWDVVRAPIAFHDTIRFLERIGTFSYIDVGPSGTLSTFIKYGLPAASASTHASVLTPFGNNLANLEALVSRYR